MPKIALRSPSAPTPASFFSHGILTAARFHLEVAGQIGLDPVTGAVVPGGVAAETEQTFKNIENILAEAGWDLSNVTKARIFLTSMADYEKMNEIYAQKFGEMPPARIAVAVRELPLGARVEIECAAAGDEISPAAREKYDPEGKVFG